MMASSPTIGPVLSPDDTFVEIRGAFPPKNAEEHALSDALLQLVLDRKQVRGPEARDFLVQTGASEHLSERFLMVSALGGIARNTPGIRVNRETMVLDPLSLPIVAERANQRLRILHAIETVSGPERVLTLYNADRLAEVVRELCQRCLDDVSDPDELPRRIHITAKERVSTTITLHRLLGRSPQVEALFALFVAGGSSDLGEIEEAVRLLKGDGPFRQYSLFEEARKYGAVTMEQERVRVEPLVRQAIVQGIESIRGLLVALEPHLAQAGAPNSNIAPPIPVPRLRFQLVPRSRAKGRVKRSVPVRPMPVPANDRAAVPQEEVSAESTVEDAAVTIEAPEEAPAVVLVYAEPLPPESMTSPAEVAAVASFEPLFQEVAVDPVSMEELESIPVPEPSTPAMPPEEATVKLSFDEMCRLSEASLRSFYAPKHLIAEEQMASEEVIAEASSETSLPETEPVEIRVPVEHIASLPDVLTEVAVPEAVSAPVHVTIREDARQSPGFDIAKANPAFFAAMVDGYMAKHGCGLEDAEAAVARKLQESQEKKVSAPSVKETQEDRSHWIAQSTLLPSKPVVQKPVTAAKIPEASARSKTRRGAAKPEEKAERITIQSQLLDRRLKYGEKFEPDDEGFVSTDALPGSVAKKEVLRSRVTEGYPLWHPDDPIDQESLLRVLRSAGYLDEEDDEQMLEAKLRELALANSKKQKTPSREQTEVILHELLTSTEDSVQVAE